MLKKLEELKEKLYRKVNDWLYTDSRIVNNLDLGTRAHVSADEDGITVSYDCVEYFSPEELTIIGNAERGSTTNDVLGVTVVLAPDEIYIAYSVAAIKNCLFGMNPLIVWSEIMNVAKHEAYHARQYRYILKHGGMAAIDRLREYMATVDYEDNIVEQGAYAYQFCDEEQDFSVFDEFINPKKTPEEESLTVAAIRNVKTN